MTSNYVLKSKRKVVFTVKFLIEVKSKKIKLRKPEKSGFLPWHKTANLGSD